MKKDKPIMINGVEILNTNNGLVTNGLKLKGNLELEICNKLVDINQEIAIDILRYFINIVRHSNFIFKSSIYFSDNEGNLTWLRVTKSEKRYVYRIIFSDNNNFAPWENECEEKYKKQFNIEDRKHNLIWRSKYER